MFRYILRRMGYGLLILIGVNLLTFFLFFTVNTPDDMARLNIGGKRITQALSLLELAQTLEDQLHIGPLLEQEHQPLQVTDARVQIDRDVFEISEPNPCFLEAILDRLRGQPCPVLTAAKTLLFDGGDELAIFHNGCR